MSTINIADVRVNGGTQSRAAIDRGVVSEYADAIKGGAAFPPITVYFDGVSYWLADGFHRYEAYALAQVYEAPADIRQGTQRDAILFSVGANASHGLRRTNDDKRRAVQTLLNDPEWAVWSNREIARQCQVDEKTVRRYREEASAEKPQIAPERTVSRGGTTYQQNTANIGASSKPDQAMSEFGTAEPAPEEGAGQDAASALEEEPAADDPEAKVRRALARLTTDGLIDEVIGLRADLDDAKAKADAVTRERDDLRAKLKEATSADLGRALGNAQRRADTATGRMNEYMAQVKRLEYRLRKAEARVKELEEMEVVPA